MPHAGTRHPGRVNRLNRLFMSRLGESVIVSIQNPTFVDQFSEPKPDVMLLKPMEEFFGPWNPEPLDVLLLVEISQTTIHYDKKIKLPLYAEAGVLEYWILDINKQVLVVLTDLSKVSTAVKKSCSVAKPSACGHYRTFRFRSTKS